jgi:hypothetical protein
MILKGVGTLTVCGTLAVAPCLKQDLEPHTHTGTYSMALRPETAIVAMVSATSIHYFSSLVSFQFIGLVLANS